MLFEGTRRTFIQYASGALGVLGGVGRRGTAATATTVSGRVFDVHDDPVFEGPVEAYTVSDAELVAETTTDREGRFDLSVETADAIELVALGSGTDPSWFDVRETAPDAAESVEMRLQRQVLFEPTVATTRDDAQLGAVTLWRWVDADDPSNQVIYLELTETRADGTAWELAGAPHGIRRGLVRVTVPESMTVHRGQGEPSVPPGTVGAAYLQRNRHRQGVAQWHPLRAPGLPSFETADGERIGVFPRHEVETGTDDGSVDLSFSLLSLVLGGVPILGTLLDVLGLIKALSGDDGLANPIRRRSPTRSRSRTSVPRTCSSRAGPHARQRWRRRRRSRSSRSGGTATGRSTTSR